MQNISFSTDNLKVKQGTCIIKNVNINLKEGDLLGIVGKSGSGKSTVIKGLLKRVKILGGKTFFSIDHKKNDILAHLGYSPQENSMYPYLTLSENMLTFGRLYGMKTEDIIRRMRIILRRLALSKAENKRINQLSGGMQKRADIAVTLIHDPKIIILDEPFNGLDIALQEFIWQFLEELAESGKIVIISSHHLADLRKHCNHLGLVEDGEFYNTEQIRTILKNNKINNIEDFLKNLFTKDRIKEI
jgi:ABC-2 type transport system ATP-binding protein